MRSLPISNHRNVCFVYDSKTKIGAESPAGRKEDPNRTGSFRSRACGRRKISAPAAGHGRAPVGTVTRGRGTTCIRWKSQKPDTKKEKKHPQDALEETNADKSLLPCGGRVGSHGWGFLFLHSFRCGALACARGIDACRPNGRQGSSADSCNLERLGRASSTEMRIFRVWAEGMSNGGRHDCKIPEN